MPKHHAGRLARRLLILSVLVAALLAPSPNSPVPEASAGPNCDSCQLMYQHCLSNCAPSCTLADESRCESKLSACMASCK